MNNEKVYGMSFSKIYPLLVNKAVKKGRSVEEVNQVIGWLTGYRTEEIEAAAKKPVVQKLRRLMRIRNEYPAFDGEVQVADLPDDTLEITRESNGCRAVLHADLKTKRFTIRCADSAFDYES